MVGRRAVGKRWHFHGESGWVGATESLRGWFSTGGVVDVQRGIEFVWGL